ncbi:unnamed protein product [Nippostrongylus brasiliensis]|uniref:Uncharacterized protein n=1 Tax=Nippostrongylus brasiliensis TaxID=27835 RepID=A0A0N4YZI0_NIPBR|nr:unnamed protein product [Nippostrongylus brasiliensis]
MVNSRPLTYTGSTIDDSVVLRPIDFIIPHADVRFLYNKDDEENDETPPMEILDPKLSSRTT